MLVASLWDIGIYSYRRVLSTQLVIGDGAPGLPHIAFVWTKESAVASLSCFASTQIQNLCGVPFTDPLLNCDMMIPLIL
jgi:hypothetical protein